MKHRVDTRNWAWSHMEAPDCVAISVSPYLLNGINTRSDSAVQLHCRAASISEISNMQATCFYDIAKALFGDAHLGVEVIDLRASDPTLRTVPYSSHLRVLYKGGSKGARQIIEKTLSVVQQRERAPFVWGHYAPKDEPQLTPNRPILAWTSGYGRPGVQFLLSAEIANVNSFVNERSGGYQEYFTDLNRVPVELQGSKFQEILETLLRETDMRVKRVGLFVQPTEPYWMSNVMVAGEPEADVEKIIDSVFRVLGDALAWKDDRASRRR